MAISHLLPNIARTPLSTWFQRKLDSRISHLTGLESMARFDHADVFIVGYPKSGHTWFQNLVAGVVYGIDTQYAPDVLVQDLIPDVHQKQYYRRYHAPMFFKSHYLPRPDYRRVVYLLRDGRDVMVSFYHHNRAIKGDQIDFLSMVQTGDESFGKWHQHVRDWLRNPFQANMLVIRYEDLVHKTAEELERFCQFVGCQREGTVITRAVEAASFSKMRLKESRYGWANKQWPKDKSFVRRGEIGSYRDEMPKPVLDAFLVDARETLSEYGYAD